MYFRNGGGRGKGGRKMKRKQTRVVRVDKETYAAFRAWRGERPTSGYGYSLAGWDDDDARLMACWNAATAEARAAMADKEA